MVEVSIRVGDEPPEVLGALGAVVGDLLQDGRKHVVDADKIVVVGLSCDGEEGRCGGGEGQCKGGGRHGSAMGEERVASGWFLVVRWDILVIT